MFISICIRHQQICVDGERWRFSSSDVCDTAMSMHMPVTIAGCPQCDIERQVEQDFLRREANVERIRTARA